MNRQQRPITDRELKSWLAAGPVDRGVGEGLTFIASGTAAQAGKASWILRYRRSGRFKEKVLGRYPELSLKEARDLARQDRAQIERGVDVAAHLAALGVDRCVAERSLNHKPGHVEGIYDRHDYFAERATALGAWAALLDGVERGTGLAKHRNGGRGATTRRPTHAGPASGQPRSATSPAS